MMNKWQGDRSVSSRPFSPEHVYLSPGAVSPAAAAKAASKAAKYGASYALLSPTLSGPLSLGHMGCYIARVE